MRLTSILLLAACLHLSARTRAQQITLSEQHSSLAKVFKKITDQTGVLFVYRDEWLKQTKDVDITVRNASLQQVLDLCFAGQPYTYEIIDKMVVLKSRPVQAALEENPNLQMDIHGRVTDSSGAPLAGASVTIKGTDKGAKTNAKGEFDMKDVRENMVLVISYTGYVSKEVTLSYAVSQVFIVLKRSTDILDASVIQAYGTTSRRFSVGSISSVDAETIEKQPVTNVLLALEGQVPGLAINATSGVPGSRVQLQIRGQNTIMSGGYFKPYDQPLFIIDGVPFAPQNNNISQLSSLAEASSFNGGINQAGGISPFNGINPADIESISVLRDADATSIYGTQGSNGVVLITTKKGKAGKTTFNLSANTGFNSDARPLKLMNGQQYAQLRKGAFAADGITPSSDPNNYSAYAPDLTIFDQNKYTDWQHVIVGKTSNITDIHASLSGGTYNNTFLISAGYTRSDFNFPGNYADQRLTLHTATHHASTDGRLTIDFGTDFGYDNNNSPGFGAVQKILLPPNTPDLLDSAGNLLWSYKGIDLSAYQFYAYLKRFTKLQNYNLNNSLHIAYKVLPGLSVSAGLGYNRNASNEHSENPASAQSPSYPYVTANFATNTFQSISVEPQIDYTVTVGKGILTALVGASYKKNVNNSNETEGSGYANDNFLGSINGAASVSSFDKFDIYKYSAGFARIKYIYDQKYIVSLTGRRDGSSNFGPGHEFGDFGSAGLGWIFSEEKGFKTVLPFISYAKISGNYGTSGSDGIAAYNYQPFWTPIDNAAPVDGVHPNTPLNLYNPNYSWALKKSLNMALDLGFFHDRLLVNATYYRDREGNQLVGYPLPAQVGRPSVLENLDAMVQNKGWEFTLNSTNIKTKAFSWTTTFNISINRNKLISFPNLEGSTYADSYIIGQPTSEVLGFRFKGLNPTTGLFEYYTGKGQPTNSPDYDLASNGGDRVPIANREVKYMGGFGNRFAYKHFSLYVFFQFSSQTSPNWLYTIYSSYFPGLGTNNLPAEALDYWKNTGDHATLQKLTSSYSSPTFAAASNFSSSSGGYSNDTYVRLKTMSLSYALPDAALKKLHIRDCNLYVNAQNLLTFTDFKVSDPEQFGDFASFPLQRTVVFGLSFNF